jgi:hypothetical protein
MVEGAETLQNGGIGCGKFVEFSFQYSGLNNFACCYKCKDKRWCSY